MKSHPKTNNKELLINHLLDRIEYLMDLKEKRKSKAVSSAPFPPTKSNTLHT